MSRQHLCHGGSADEYAVPQSLASPTLGKGAPDGSDEVGRAGRNNRYVGLHSDSELKARISTQDPAILR